MPQPLSKVMPVSSFVIGNVPDRPLQRHPELATLAMEAIASWSNVENFMLKMFVQLFGGHESLATNIFLALENQSAKNAAISAAAETVLKDNPDELAVFKAIMAISTTNGKSRNKLVHWTWGESPDIHDGLLLINPKSCIGKVDKSQIYVYRESDFISIIKANNNLCAYGHFFNLIIQKNVANNNGQLLAKLKEEPEIKERLKEIS